MSTYFIGCLHLGHESIAKYRGFSDSWEHDEWLTKCWNSVVSKRDKVFILGDITMETWAHYYKLDQLNGYKEVVLGNHDRATDIPRMLEHVDKVSGVVDYNGYILTHVPIHPSEISFYKGNIHAHIHHNNKLQELVAYDRYQDKGSKEVPTVHKYINVDAKLIDFKPLSFEQIENRV